MIIGVIADDRVVCVGCYMNDPTIPTTAEYATSEGYPDGFTCDECDWVVA